MNSITKNLILILLIITSCTPRYDVQITNVEFEHPEGVNYDLIKYVATNPTTEDLQCELKMKFEGEKSAKENFEIKSQETKNLTINAKLPFGNTSIKIITSCQLNQ
ncbi:hypothetical protein CMO90_02630 [Candidatus Woesearchaeota archaeon]|jgi:hypothetical protein|nr:hypothetical protein [Candidatus Woesearchaeota archaeon]|tara:strand:- start:162 stop:479 length:318 start_codon:yes stop_codon:yes gene_type:complete